MEKGTQLFDIANVRDILTVLFKHKYKILIAFLIIGIGVTIFAFSMPTTYESKSIVLVKFGREFMARPEEGRTGATPTIPPQAILAGEIRILTSRDLLARVIDGVGPQALYPGIANVPKRNLSHAEASVELFEQSLSVKSLPGSSLIEIVFTHRDPVMAARVVNMLVDLFKEKHLEVFGGEGTTFLENHLNIFEKKLKESESNLANFRQKYRVFSFEEQRTNLIGQRATLDTSLKAALTQISELEQKIAFTKSPRWTVDTAAELRTQLAALQQRERELLEKYVEGSRSVQNVRQEMQAAKDAVRRNTEEARQIELAKAEGELTIAKARADTLRRQLGQVEGEIRNLDARSRELTELRRETAGHEQNYQTYVKRLEESRIMDDMDQRKMVAIRVVEKAMPSPEPKKGKFSKSQLIPMGFFGGIAAGIVLAFLLEFLAPGMTVPLSAERRLGLPVIVTVVKK
ncbi:GumC family protein [Syntrophorhabdus aromaticivorans]|uniref:GumC family protein n=1 Tax=Syntrophorhabdus aromaticivorans TaxID=328301 RepID=A0A351U0Q6_9BACT|nr:GumC family protein [Syntrophorhabdus aromaticivorans]NLW36643.1 GumC family protein [Syntrophorhabdus aromaticivorans]HBA53537.1 hypothetical protein [Syntrophorhabdus aromaticivorans]